MSKIIYEIMHRENCVAQISTVGECKIYLEDFMPYDLTLEESNDFDKRNQKCDELLFLVCFSDDTT